MAAARRQTSTRRAAPVVADTLPWETATPEPAPPPPAPSPVQAWIAAPTDTSALPATEATSRVSPPQSGDDVAAASVAAPGPFPAAPLWNDVEITAEHPWYGAPKGEAWRFLFYDRAAELHLAGTGPTAWAALAALVDDWHRRAVLRLPFSPARTA